MKQDRFAQMVAKLTYRDDWGIRAVSRHDAIALLRRQHAAMVRMVTGIERRHRNPQDHAVYSHGFVKACEDIKAALAQYKKGTP